MKAANLVITGDGRIPRPSLVSLGTGEASCCAGGASPCALTDLFAATASKQSPKSGSLQAPSRVVDSSMSEEKTIDYCRECKRPLTEIDNRRQILRGCLSCNIWWSGSGERVRLSEEDLHCSH
jgi:hypothetical protein